MKQIVEIIKLLGEVQALIDSLSDNLDAKEQELKLRKEYSNAKDMLTKLELLSQHKQALEEICKSMTDSFNLKPDSVAEDISKKKKRQDLSHLKQHERTPEDEYYLPILQSLMEKGGSATMKDVLIRVGDIMKPILKNVDYELLKSLPHTVRWINAAQWARNTMVHELGLLKKGSKRGVWEITQRGIGYYQNNKK